MGGEIQRVNPQRKQRETRERTRTERGREIERQRETMGDRKRREITEKKKHRTL